MRIEHAARQREGRKRERERERESEEEREKIEMATGSWREGGREEKMSMRGEQVGGKHDNLTASSMYCGYNLTKASPRNTDSLNDVGQLPHFCNSSQEWRADGSVPGGPHRSEASM